MTGVINWDVTPSSNTSIGGTNVQENNAPSTVNDGMRKIMSEGKAGIIGMEFRNLALTVSVAANALTIALKGQDGNNPSGTNAVLIPFRNVTLTAGTLSYLSVEAAASLVISSGSTLGTSDGVAARIWVLGINDGSTFRLGAVFAPSATAIGDDILISSTTEGGSGGADTAGTIYSGSGVTSKAMRILGFIDSTQTTAGTWAATVTKVQTYNGLQSDFHDRQVTAQEIKDYSITHSAVSSSGGTLTLDYSTGQSFTCTLTENVSTVTVSNPPVSGKYGEIIVRLVQDSTARTVTWASGYKFPAGVDHTMSTGSGAVDIVTLKTIDGGTTWHCDFSNGYA